MRKCLSEIGGFTKDDSGVEEAPDLEFGGDILRADGGFRRPASYTPLGIRFLNRLRGGRGGGLKRGPSCEGRDGARCGLGGREASHCFCPPGEEAGLKKNKAFFTGGLRTAIQGAQVPE